jgi:hypothetical protein
MVVDLREQAAHHTPEQLLQHLKHFDVDLKFSTGIRVLDPDSLAHRGLQGLEAYLLHLRSPRSELGKLTALQ